MHNFCLPSGCSCSLVCQKVRQIKKVSGSLPAVLTEIPLQPQQLWGLHFWGNLPPNKFQYPVAPRVYFLRLLDCPVVLPENDIPLRIVRETDCDWLSVMAHGHQGTGSSEAKPPNFRRTLKT